MNAAVMINQTSGDVEYYTPVEIIRAANQLFGQIDLDPASSEIANQTVQATRIFTRYNDGMKEPWLAKTLWMNHPFGKQESACKPGCARNATNPKHVCHDFDWHGNTAWIQKLIKETICGNVQEALCITYACTSEAWFKPLLYYPQCYLTPRTQYRTPDGKVKVGVTKGSVVTYFGAYLANFKHLFQRKHELGVVKI